MRMILLGFAFVSTIVPASIEAAGAREVRPWCFKGGRGSPGGGLPDCSYSTLEQCRLTIGGGNEGCFRNPALEWDRIEGRRPAPSRR